jgi:hypothetical protein
MSRIWNLAIINRFNEDVILRLGVEHEGGTPERL